MVSLLFTQPIEMDDFGVPHISGNPHHGGFLKWGIPQVTIAFNTDTQMVIHVLDETLKEMDPHLVGGFKHGFYFPFHI